MSNMFESDCSTPDFTWTIDGIKEKLEQNTIQIESPPFLWREYPVLARAKLVLNEEGEVRVSMDVQHVVPDVALQFPVLPAVVYLIRDRSGSSEPRHVLRHSTHLLGSECTYVDMYKEFLVHKSRLTDKSSVYNAEDSICVEIFVETPSAIDRLYSCDGRLHVWIPGYRRLKRLEEEGCVTNNDCPYIYTGYCGYRVQVNFHLTTVPATSEDAMAVSVCFLTGLFDEELSLDFPHRTTITVYNPKHQERFVTTMVERNIDRESTYSFPVCGNEGIGQILGTDDDLCFYLTITPFIEQGGIEERLVVDDDSADDDNFSSLK